MIAMVRTGTNLSSHRFSVCQVIEKANSIFERLQGNFIPEADAENQYVIEKRLEKQLVVLKSKGCT